ncbi:MAG: asparagine synthase (glutamine-hydrolyzing) [Desulfobacteraceae bacterium]|nr:asparagine synthase (glutamine-hydrolyzing) [Desulfobacteraceae bacterium]MBC2757089.1 asparagine synthase (glutamine-hydrolyzing) [Desulfobacteraceae bacterium]MBC2763694.1 asparagine synthase (glutamine-hydrolyzing) [ANME-2 cluster archaeon]
MISPDLTFHEISRRVDQMNGILQHRGPDDRKKVVYSVCGKTVGLGFVRLSILDLETGMQPIQCGLDDTLIICNGQIYNFIELKEMVKAEPFVSKGDVEVALHLYRIKGIDFLSYLNGMYAGAIFDPRQSRLFLFRDRFGIKPLYYLINKNDFLFSSEIKPLLAGGNICPEMNSHRLATYFTYRYIPGSETLFKGIRRVPPGSFLEYDLISGKYQVKRYWDYRLDAVNHDIIIDDAADRFYDLFSDSVKIRLRSDVEVGSLISGGIDSSAVSAQAAMQQPALRLFSIAFEEEKYNELANVKNFLTGNPDKFNSAKLNSAVCRKNHLKYLPEIVKSLEEPVSLGTLLPTDMVCEMAAKQVKVVLTGEGADEIFAGYRKFMIESAASQFMSLSEKKQNELLHLFPELNAYLVQRKNDPASRYIQNEALFASDEILKLTGQKPPLDLFSEDAPPFLKGNEDPVNQAIAFETRFRLPDYVILRLDRLSMRHSLEARTPLLDYRLAEFAAMLPVNLKVDLESVREKYICSHSYLKYSILDHETAYRRKQPFTIPIADWLAAPDKLPDFLQEILFGDIIRRQGILDPEYAWSLAGQITTHGIGPETLVSVADQVFSIIIFTLWYQEFFSCSFNFYR